MKSNILTKELFKKILGDAFDAGIDAENNRKNTVRSWGDFDEWYNQYESDFIKNQEKTYIKKSTYLIDYTVDKEGKSTIHRMADGFNAFELLGVLEIARSEIIKQISGEIKPDFIKRDVIM